MCQLLSGKECKTQEPIIHLLYSEMSDFLKSILLKFIKYDVVGEIHGHKLQTIDVHNSKNSVHMDKLEIDVHDQESLQTMMRELCMALPTVDDMEVIKVTDEWKIYRSETISNDKIYKDKQLVRNDCY
ncbi:hypothetical protein DPMN_026145, partial [Dreissena polymorpha]